MGFRRSANPQRQDPFTDLLFNVLLAFTFLFVVSLLLLNPPAKSGIIDPKAEFIVTVSWPQNNPDDVDTWLEDPEGNLLWFSKPSSGLMHLDRDDRGMANDEILVDGERIANPLSQEVITIRGFIEGEYVVNLHYYHSETGKPVEATVSVAKVNPKLEVVYFGNHTLDKEGDERTAVRFEVTADGKVRNIGTLPKSIVTVN